MKRLARYSFSLLLFISCVGYCFAQDTTPPEIITKRPAAEYDPKSWKEFSSKEGRFTILFPGVPAQSSYTVETPYGKIEQHGFILKTFAYYAVAYSDFPEKDGIRDINAFFAGIRVGTLRATNAELLEEKDYYRFATPGRFIMTRIQGGYINRIRLHMIRNRLYMLSVVMPEGDAEAGKRKFYEATALKFLDSFQPEIDESSGKQDRLGDPRLRTPPLPATGITVDPAIAAKLPPSQEGKSEDAKINGGILNGKALSMPRPSYPAEAKAAGASGEVKVKIVIDESGNVISAKAVSGHQLLQAASEDAAYKAKFQPTKLNGEPVKIMGFLVYKFVSK